MSFVGLDPQGTTGLHSQLGAQADDLDHQAAAVTATLSGLALSSESPALLGRTAEDDRLAARVVQVARELAESYSVCVKGELTALQAALLAALGRRWEQLGGLQAAAGDVAVDGTDGADTIRIRVDGDEVVVDVNGTETRIPLADAANLVVRASGGNDTIVVDPGVDVSLVILGGDGDDDIRSGAGNDIVLGGAGIDYVDGGRGADHLYGNEDDDVLYGLDGDDVLVGGTGVDHLEGAEGSDRLFGGDGDDMLSGGHGDDVIHGGGDDDTLYSGTGADLLDGGAGQDTAYHNSTSRSVDDTMTMVRVEIDPNLGSSVTVSGDDDFIDRVNADLALLAASPTGQGMLRALDQAAEDSEREGSWFFNWGANDGNRVTITELVDEQNGFATPDDRGDALQNDDGEPGPGTDGTIQYNPGFILRTRPDSGVDSHGTPVVVLFHEMAHTWNYVTGTGEPGVYDGDAVLDRGINELEREAVGLPIDHDGDPSTPEQPAPLHPQGLTENALRQELGLPDRSSYRNRPR